MGEKISVCIRTGCGVPAEGHVSAKTKKFEIGTPKEFCIKHGRDLEMSYVQLGVL